MSKIEDMYDRVAKEYAKAFSGEHEKKPMDREMLGRFSRMIEPGAPVLDVGCGPGQTTGYLSGLGLNVSGVDQSEKMLEQARERCPEHFFGKGDMLELSFDADSIAGMVSFYSIVHFTNEQIDKAFREFHRVLKPGGVLLLAFHVGKEMLEVEEFLGMKVEAEFMFFQVGFIRDLLEKTGFDEIELFERDPYPELEFQSRRAYAFARKAGGRGK